MKYTAEYDDGFLLEIEAPSRQGAKKRASHIIHRHPGSIIIRDASGEIVAISLYSPKRWYPFSHWMKWRTTGQNARRKLPLPTLEELLAAVEERKMTPKELQAFKKARWFV